MPVTNLNRRCFLFSGTVGSISVFMPLRKLRFNLALKKAVKIKKIELKMSLDEIVDGRIVSDYVYEQLDIPLWQSMLNWILNNWELVLKTLLTVITILDEEQNDSKTSI